MFVAAQSRNGCERIVEPHGGQVFSIRLECPCVIGVVPISIRRRIIMYTILMTWLQVALVVAFTAIIIVMDDVQVHKKHIH